VSRLWRAWVALLDRREPGTSLALFRIGVGLCVLLTIGSVVHAHLVGVIWVSADHGGGYRSMTDNWLVQALGGATPAVIGRLVVASLAGGVLLTVGLGGRVVALLTLQTTLAVTDVNGQAAGSYDLVLTNALWLLVLADSTATLSVDCRLSTGAWTSERRVPVWPRYLVIFQLFLMYWTTGLQKVAAEWTPAGGFSALYYILQQPTWQRFDMSWVAWIYPLTQVGTAVTWAWELGAPLLLLAYFWRYTADRPGRLRAWANRVDLRSWYALLGVAFHVLVTIPMNIGPFSAICLACYPCLFTPDEVRRFVGRFRPDRVKAGRSQGRSA